MSIQPKIAVGTLAGMTFGGWVAGEACARTYSLLNPAQAALFGLASTALNPMHAAMFGLASTVAAYVIHKGIQWMYQNEYDKIPTPLKVVMNLSTAVLLIGGLASDCFGVNIMIPVALKIISGSLIFGSLGWFAGKSLTVEAPAEPILVPLA